MLRVVDLASDPPVVRPAGPDDLAPPPRGGLVWIDAESPTPAELDRLAASFRLHPLAVEDMREHGQRQKAESYPEHLLLVLQDPGPDVAHPAFAETFAAVGPRWVVTVHDAGALDVATLAERVVVRPDLATNAGMAVVAALVDHAVDGYEVVVDRLEEQVAHQEEQVLDVRTGDPTPTLREAALIRGRIARFRRAAAQLREALGVLVRRELMDREHTQELDLELRDVTDHVQRALDDLAVLHDRMTALAEARLAMVAYRQNEITKRLSAWGAILLVPTVVTGWFGQNFKDLWLLTTPAGPAITLAGILVACAALWWGFRRADWL